MEENSTEMDVKVEGENVNQQTTDDTQNEQVNLGQCEQDLTKENNVFNNTIKPEEIDVQEIKQEVVIKEEEKKNEEQEIKEQEVKVEEVKVEELKVELFKQENKIKEDVVVTLDENPIEAMEPGELPTNNDGQIIQDTDMNVLEAILGDGDAAKDDFDNEIANTTSMKRTRSRTKAATSITPKVKKTPKRKAKKTPKKAESQSSTTEKILSVKDDDTKTIAEAPAESKPLSGLEDEKTKPKVSATLPVNISGESQKTPTKPIANNGKTPNKSTKKKKATKTVNKKEVKKPESKAKKVDNEGTDLKQDEKEKELEIKVKELEKLVKAPPLDTEKTLLEAGSENATGKSPTSTRKRKISDSSKDKPRKPKIKQEEGTMDPPVDKDLIEDFTEDELLNDITNDKLEGDMKVVDGYSDHESNFSFSRSRSFSGSYSVELSNLSGSSLDDIDDDQDKNNSKRKKKHTSAEKVQEHKDFIDEMLKGARYFIIKSNNYENVSLSKAKAVWATPPANERKLNDAFKHSTNVILVFSVKESGRFQGFARLASESRHDGIPVPWVLPPGFDRRILGGTFKVDWLNRKEVTFSKCANLRNPWNENKEVKICRDGQELEPSVGEVLCRMFEDDLTIDFERILRHAKRYKSQDHKPDRFKRGNFHGNDWRGRGGFRGGGRGGGRGGARGGGRFQPRGTGDFRRKRGTFGGGGASVGAGRFHHDNRRQDRRRDQNPHQHRGDHRRPVDNNFMRPRSRSPDHRRYERENRDRRHKDRVREFLKEDRSKYGVREETLLHGSYSDYVREFRQKQLGNHRSSSSSSHNHHNSSSYNSSSYGGTSGRHSYEANAASAEEFLRRSMRSSHR